MLLQMALFHYFYGWVIFHCKQLTHWKSPWSWERLRAEGEEGIRGWDGWMASPMQWTCCCCCKSLQSCLTLCDPIDGSHQAPPSLGFSMQEHWKRLPFPSPMHESEKWKVKVKSFSCVWPFATLWTAAYQAPPSMGFSRQEYWSGVPLPTPAMDMNLRKLQEMVWDSKAWYVAVHGVEKSWTWLGNWSTATKIFHCMYVSHLLYPFLCQWMLRLLPYLGYCEYCCYEYRDTCIFFN